jgi:hypothetical protein
MIAECRRFRAWTGKRRHATQQEAEQVGARQTNKWKLDERVQLVAYRCGFCHCFHTGRRYEP